MRHAQHVTYTHTYTYIHIHTQTGSADSRAFRQNVAALKKLHYEGDDDASGGEAASRGWAKAVVACMHGGSMKPLLAPNDKEYVCVSPSMFQRALCD